MGPLAQKLLCFLSCKHFLTGSYFDGEVGLKSGAPRKGLHDSIALLTKISLGFGRAKHLFYARARTFDIQCA